MQDLAYFEFLMREWFLQWNLTYAAIVFSFVVLGILLALAVIGIGWIASSLRSSRKRKQPQLRVVEPTEHPRDYESVA